MSSSRIALIAGLLAVSFFQNAQGQLTPIGKEMRIRKWLPLAKVGDIPADSVRLQWSCVDAGKLDTASHKVLVPGMLVTRETTLNGAKVSYTAPLLKAETITHITGEPAPDGFDGARAILVVDKTTPSRVHVNPLLWEKSPTTVKCGNKEVTPVLLRDSIEFYYDLKNRQTIHLSNRSMVAGAVVIPVRVRRAYTATNGRPVDGGVSADLSAGALYGFAWGKSRYQYVKHAENPITETRRFTLALFGALGKASVDTASSRSADQKIDRPLTFATLSPGIATMLTLGGIDVGLFVAPELSLRGGDAQKWDYNRKFWYGIGFSYQAPK